MKNRKELISTLEDTLVNQFRKLQTLSSITREERKALINGDVTSLNKITEQKESVLDSLGLLEDSRRMVTDSLCKIVGLPEDKTTITELIKTFEPDIADRISHLQGGISKLVEEARNLNMGNQALAVAHCDLIRATQAFLYSFYETPASYQPYGAPPSKWTVPITDVEHQA